MSKKTNIKKLIFSTICLTALFVLMAPSFTSAQTIIDGDLIRTEGTFDIYIVKLIGVKKFKRLILNPAIFESYGHLKWEDVKDIQQSVLDEHTTSNLVIEVNPDGSVADPKVYTITSPPNSDVGERHHLDVSAAEFEAHGLDWDSLYHVNHTEASPSFYPTKIALKNTDDLFTWATTVNVTIVLQETSQLSINGITPNNIVSGQTTNVTITGTNFESGATIKIGANASATNVVVVNSTKITATIPSSLSPGTYNIIISNPDGESFTFTNSFIVSAPETLSITSVTPNQMINSIDNFLTITGTNFRSDAIVFIGSYQSPSVTFVNSTTLSAKIVTGIAPGTYSIQVTTDGTSATLQNTLTIIAPTVTPPTTTELTTAEIAAKVSPAVVQIKNDIIGGTGSGFIIDSAGYILTNEHVIRNDNIVEVKLDDGTIISGNVLGWNQIKDLAIVKISNSNDFVSLGNSDSVVLGEKAVALGYPLTNFPGSITVLEGIISNTNVIDTLDVTYLQTSANVQHGSSGGPLVNTNGDVLGINSWCPDINIVSGLCPAGFALAIKINEAKSVLADLKAGTQTAIPTTEPEPDPEPDLLGTLTVANSFDTPPATNYTQGASSLSVFKFILTAANENINVTTIKVRLWDATNNTNETAVDDTDFENIKLYDGATLLDTVSLASGIATFNLTGFSVPKNSTKTLSVTLNVPFNSTLTNNLYLTIGAVNGWGSGITDAGELTTTGASSLQAITEIGDAISNAMTEGTPTFTLDTSSTPAAKSVVMGATSVWVGRILVTANNESIKITSVKISADDFSGLDSASNADSIWSNVKIKVNGSTITGGGPKLLTSGTPDYVLFDGLNVTINKDQTGTIDIYADAVGATGSWYFGHVNGGDIVGSGISSGISVTSTASKIVSQPITITSAGSVTSSVDADTPVSQNVAVGTGGATGVTFSKVKFEASNIEDLIVKKVRLTLSGGAAADFSAIKLYDGATQIGATGYMAASTVDFIEDNVGLFTIAKGTSKVITVKADLNGTVAGGDAIIGDGPRLYIVDVTGTADGVNADIKVQGIDSAGEVDSSVGNPNPEIAANFGTMYIYKSVPTVSLNASSPSGSQVGGTGREMLRFDVSVNSLGDVLLESVTITVSGNADITSTEASGNAYLYKSTDLVNALATVSQSGYGTEGVLDSGNTVVFANINETIAAGTTKTFVVKGDTTGADDGTGTETIQLNISQIGDFSWSDTIITGVTTLTAGLPLTGGTLTY